MDKLLEEAILNKIGGTKIHSPDTIQTLWSGYGKLVRYSVNDSNYATIIIKHISPPSQTNHPRGWNTNISHQRKLKSYEIEKNWYLNWNANNIDCYTPRCIYIHQQKNEWAIVLEDLDTIGYPERIYTPSWNEVRLGISWLAYFHAFHLQKEPDDLWKTGSYWHLDTRPDELNQLTDLALKNAAKNIDDRLNNAQFKTIIHGDAKLANFCFSSDKTKIAAVDFQYIGGGCGMKDIAYFVGSCFDEYNCERYENQILDTYFNHLKSAIQKYDIRVNFNELETEWRALYPIAWTDFHRFIKGWSPGHWKINSYSERIAKSVIDNL